MPHLEPTYLRYIYDGLVKGSIHPENAAELPEGLIGLYEEAFDERTSVIERQKLLQRFAIWALLKKEVSAAFVAEVLGDTEDEIQDFISKYSAWFNSPESGKYQLYHERLKVYLLQKLSEGEVHSLHEKLISRLERAIEEQKADEFEWYGLEFLGVHYAVNAMLIGDGSKLLAIAYDQNHWQRQLKISKGYNWTKNGLKSVMAWASKYKDDEVIECGLQMVDLHHQEQNAAPQIVALVAEGDFESAMKRIEQFGGNDKEGLQRKFILYMLCLMELTLLESKNKPFRKEGIDKLLKHLDDRVPAYKDDQINGSFLFPNKLMFQILCELDQINIDFSIILHRQSVIGYKCLDKNSKISQVEKEVIIKISSFYRVSLDVTVTDANIKDLLKLSKLLFTNNYVIEAELLLTKAKELSNQFSESSQYRDFAIKDIILGMKFQNKEQEAHKLLDKIKDSRIKAEVFLILNEDSIFYNELISKSILASTSIYGKLGILELGIKYFLLKNKLKDDLIEQFIDLLDELENHEQPRYQKFLVGIYCELNEIEKAIKIVNEIELIGYRDDPYRSIALWFRSKGMIKESDYYLEKIKSTDKKADFYSYLIITGSCNNKEIDSAFQKMIFEIKKITEFSTDDWGCVEYPRNELIETIANRLTGHGFIDLAIKMGLLLINVETSIQQYYHKILSDIDFLEDGKLSEYFHTYFLKSSIELNVRQSDEFLFQIIKKYWIEEKYIQALKLISYIKDNDKKLDEIISNLLTRTIEELNLTLIPDLLKFISSDSSKGEILDKVISKSDSIFDSPQIIQIFSNFTEEEKDRRLSYFIRKQIDLGRQNVAIKLLPIIVDPYWKCIVLEHLVYCAGKIKNVELGTKFLEEIKKLQKKSKLNVGQYSIEMQFYDYLSIEYYKAHDISWQIFNKKSIDISKKIKNLPKYKKCNIHLQLLWTKQYDLLANNIDSINDEYERSRIIQEISSELFSIQHIEIINKILNIYPEKHKNSSEYINFVSNFIIFCESNNVNIDLEIHYKYFVSSWTDSLELAKQLFLINRKEKSLNVLNKIERFNGLVLIDFAEFLRLNEYYIYSKQILDNAISISILENKSKWLKKAVMELMQIGNNSLAEEISLQIKDDMEKQECWIKIGGFISKNQNPKKTLNTILNFQNKDLKEYALKGLINEIDILKADKANTIKLIGLINNDTYNIENILFKHSLNNLFIEEAIQENLEPFSRSLNLQWAIDIKNQLPN